MSQNSADSYYNFYQASTKKIADSDNVTTLSKLIITVVISELNINHY